MTDGKDFSGLHRHLALMSGPSVVGSEERAVAGLLVQRQTVTPVRVPVMAHGIVMVVAAEDVSKRERATALPDGGVGGRGDARVGETYPDRQRLDAWWGRPVRAGEVGYLKVGEPWTDDELARLP